MTTLALKRDRRASGLRPCSRSEWGRSRPAHLAVVAIFATTALVAAGCRLGTGGAVSREIAACRQLSQSGRIAIERGDLTAAESFLAQAIKSHPDDPDARRSYADVLWRRGAHEEALLQAQEALRLAEDDPTIAVQLGEMWLSLGRLDQARTLADQAIDTDPRAAAAWGLRARVKLRDGQHEAALADLHRALEFSPHDQKLLLEAAEVYRVLGRPNRALSVLAALRETYPGGEEPAQVLYWQGLAFAALERHSEAIDAYVAAVERDATNAEILSRLADAQLQAGQVAAAEQAVRKALAVDPNHSLARAVWTRVEGLRTARVPGQPSPWQRPESSAPSSRSLQPLR